jgi:filamentous hemagglutinin
MPAAGQRGIWDIASDLERGAAAEARLGGRTGLHLDFPVIDRFENGVATSVKTMNLGLPSHHNTQQIISTGQRYIDAVSRFAVSGSVRRAGVIIRPSQVTQRALDLVVPPWATPAQRQALQQLVEYGSRQNPPVIVRIVEMQ